MISVTPLALPIKDFQAVRECLLLSLVRVFSGFKRKSPGFFRLTQSFHLTIMVRSIEIALFVVRKRHPGVLALALRS